MHIDVIRAKGDKLRSAEIHSRTGNEALPKDGELTLWEILMEEKGVKYD